MNSYLDELELLRKEANLPEVVFHKDVDQALDFFDRNAGQITLFILDIMMAHGKRFDAASTGDGRRAGVRVYEYVRSKNSELPVVVLTNVTDPQVIKRFQEEKNCWFLQKKDHFPFEVGQIVVGILQRPEGSPGLEGLA